MKTIKTKRGDEILVDDDDYEWLSSMKWNLDGHGYAKNGKFLRRTENRKVRIKSVWMHRLIMNAQKGQMVDHKNRNRLDNRRENLRFATHSQNQANRKVTSKHGFRGVHKEGGKWVARCSKDGVRSWTIHDTIEEAARGYDILAKELHGEFAALNFP